MCELCTLAASSHVVGSDSDFSYVSPKSGIGVVLVIPKQHGTLAELATREILFTKASALSSMLFDGLGAHGTNIIIEDSEHAHAIIAARTEDDGVPWKWEGKRATAEELAETAKRIKEETWYIGKEQKVEKKISITGPRHAPPQSATTQQHGDDDPSVDTPTEVAADLQRSVKQGPTEEHNYLIKQLTRRR